MKKYVYFFGPGGAEGMAGMKALLGGKGANIAEMTNLNIPVPPGFTISTEACNEYFKNNKKYPDDLWEEVEKNITRLEDVMGIKFGSNSHPLLVSVRSGGRASMPGMMDTVLNLGLNENTIRGLIEKTRNERFVYDAYRRFITMFSGVVFGIKKKKRKTEDGQEIEINQFEEIMDKIKNKYNASLDTDLNVNALKELVEKYKLVVRKETEKNFPEDPKEQLRMAINAVFESWNNQRAITYRKLYGIPDNWGTAVNVQAMVFGNMGDTSGTGVAFTRDPASGEKRFFGEFLLNAQGEDVVAGIRNPFPIEELKNNMPEVYKSLVDIYQKLETHYRDMQDIEFTIQDKKLYMLQTRTGKRTAAAAVRIAVEMVKEGLIDKKTALLRVEPEQLDQLLHPTVDPKAKAEVIAKGLPASPGAGIGKVVFTTEAAQEMASKGEKVILVRQETSPEDIAGMNMSQGILTVTGGMTSHAAVVARGMGKCCIAGCKEIIIEEVKRQFRVNNTIIKEGDWITLDGSTGMVMKDKVKLIQPELSGNFAELMQWADEVRRLKVRTNADTPHDAQVARDFGAEGIGLCRTEHMFFEAKRIDAVREMILSDTEEERRRALSKILPMQRGDFKEIFKVMEGYPVTIRLLDPPLHEFLPHTDEDIEALAKEMNVPVNRLKEKANSLKEFNPMLGHRGCRLGITYPEIYEMQVQSIFEAACEFAKKGKSIEPEVMIPLIVDVNELRYTKERLTKVANDVMERMGVRVKYMFGTMIELPRAAITADKIAAEAEFFSFGTNDLTQTTFGLSRDDAGNFLPFYLEKKIFPKDPFVVIDQDGVGELIKMGVEKGRAVRTNLKVGICGEHGGEPSSVAFCHKIGLNYVSCSPFRVPIARLAAAHAVLKEGMADTISTTA
ncbi:MAG: pyruvate, phosphate dikinase [Nitrospinae bacterium RIFCSPLOWO2_02_FULL_39_110]|nr:MAG: pyruvate, phosphate dikinase [Nitrospinae bacterium RIFCSPHIGHO2_02_39_11]OGV99625.1 MAG: pyruvate, phosphate dikinase [Nitrospinae bacterium RIFCSPHIGHO2_12_FULL_39_42]OGW01169.1 MAG: pyruvate, phosphate dikinase [Nitrospinae bacterium RIFCSPHIGHO2_02_FULL_39_82]OGW05300.1 MAG: pyruvate, phosphate dikinase [Nitrospinae bacterium RIFCSPLOWO2_02_FULL_39_110]OGW05543.1 MAG: pyruvate, phosphate dikinase [Nitrospinae bacterium RIFCSPLOWO2_02_39_17]OGW10091.1 MAG: pyruvate, phosphate dikina